MNAKEVKNIKITDYFYSKGIHPRRTQGVNYWYLSPFREEQTPSFKVNHQLNVWYDYGTGQGGNIIDLIMKIHSLPDVAEALRLFNKNILPPKQKDSFSFQQQKESSGTEIIKVQPLTNLALIDYLNERKINIDIARQHCQEVYYTANQKNYFAIGFKNESGGYELRNKYFKGCTSKDITIHPSEDKKNCLVFEGFIDYLSFLTLKNTPSIKPNVVILNSVSNLSKAIGFIQSFPNVYTFLDNDKAGQTTTEQIKAACTLVHDQSYKYSKYKDINDLLCRKEVLNDCKHEINTSILHDVNKSINQSVPKNRSGKRMKF